MGTSPWSSEWPDIIGALVMGGRRGRVIDRQRLEEGPHLPQTTTGPGPRSPVAWGSWRGRRADPAPSLPGREPAASFLQPRHSLKSLTSTPDPRSSRTSFLMCLHQGLLFVLQNSMGFEKYIMPFICQYLSNTVRNFIILKIPFHLPCPPPQPQPRSNH